jgi:hypothetical protein
MPNYGPPAMGRPMTEEQILKKEINRLKAAEMQVMFASSVYNHTTRQHVTIMTGPSLYAPEIIRLQARLNAHGPF